MTFLIRPATDTDIPAIVDTLWAVQQDSQGVYPPRHLAPDRGAVQSWLERYPMQVRLVAVDMDDATVVGHVGIVAAEDTDPDLPKWFAEHDAPVAASDLLELTRLFVAPRARRAGVGKLLLDAATNHIIDLGYRPALCVMDTQEAARALYLRSGWEALGTFVGLSGRVNHLLLGPKNRVKERAANG